MKIQDIITELEKSYPLQTAVNWDNSGLQAGRRDKEAGKVFLALDATDQVIEEAKKWGADLLLTHHPLIMNGIKSVSDDCLQGRKAMELIRADITHYAMHTNFDIITMASISAKLLGLEEAEVLDVQSFDQTGVPQGFGRVGSLKTPMTVRELSEKVKQDFGLKHVKVFGDLCRIVQRAAILPGSGKSMVEKALQKNAEVMVSGDFGHHDGLDAVDSGLIVIDAGHYGLEHIFMGYMENFIKEHFPELEVRVMKPEDPFEIL